MLIRRNLIHTMKLLLLLISKNQTNRCITAPGKPKLNRRNLIIIRAVKQLSKLSREDIKLPSAKINPECLRISSFRDVIGRIKLMLLYNTVGRRA